MDTLVGTVRLCNHVALDETWGYCHPNWEHGCIYDAKKLGIIPPAMSCMMRSKMSFKYGRVEVRAQMPKGDWLWPGIWLMPKNSVYGSWPKSGEMDIAETTGNTNYGNLGVQRATASLHLGNSATTDKHLTGWHFLHGETYGDRFFTYAMDWTETHIKFYVDNILVYGLDFPKEGMHKYLKLPGENIWGSKPNTPFDQDFYMLMQVSVGGTQAMFFDWVRNYPHPMPWKYNDTRPAAMEKFWRHKNDWYPTWKGEAAAMKIDEIQVWTY